MAQTYSAYFAHELKKVIESEIRERTESLGNGLGVVDFVDYKHKVGIITGLRLVLNDLFELAEENCTRKEFGRQ